MLHLSEKKSHTITLNMTPIKQNGSICKTTAIAAIEKYFSEKIGHTAIHLHKSESNAWLSLRQIAKNKFGSQQGELLEIKQVQSIFTYIGYDSAIKKCHSSQELKETIVAHLSIGLPLITFFAVDTMDRIGLPTDDFDGLNEHAAVIVGIDIKNDTVQLMHWGKTYRSSLEKLYSSMMSLPEERNPEYYRSIKYKNSLKKYDLVKDEHDLKELKAIKKSIQPEKGSGFRGKLVILNKLPSLEAFRHHRKKIVLENVSVDYLMKKIAKEKSTEPDEKKSRYQYETSIQEGIKTYLKNNDWKTFKNSISEANRAYFEVIEDQKSNPHDHSPTKVKELLHNAGLYLFHQLVFLSKEEKDTLQKELLQLLTNLQLYCHEHLFSEEIDQEEREEKFNFFKKNIIPSLLKNSYDADILQIKNLFEHFSTAIKDDRVAMETRQSFVEQLCDTFPDMTPGNIINLLEKNSYCIDDHAQLLMAAERDDLSTVKKLLEDPTKVIDPNKKLGKQGAFPLYLAAQNGHLSIVEYLLTFENVDFNLQTSTDNPSPLHIAIEHNHLEIVKLLLTTPRKKYQINLNTKLKNLYDPLSCAVLHGQTDMVKLLLAAGANPYKIIIYGRSLLEHAVTKNHIEISLLIDDCKQDFHTATIQRMIILGFKAHNKGICFGWDKIAGLFALSGKEYFHEFIRIFYLSKSLKAREIQAMQHFHDDAYKQTPRKPFTIEDEQREKNYIDILTLFNGIELAFSGENFSFLLNKRTMSQRPASAWVMPLIQPIALERKGGPVELAVMTGVYDKTEFADFFIKLRKRIRENQNIQEFVILSMVYVEHAISVLYDPMSDIWMVLDINNIPEHSDELKKGMPGSTDISLQVAAYLHFEKSSILLETYVITTRAFEKIVKPAIDLWMIDIAPFHEVTPKKLKYLNTNQQSWLHIAAIAGDEKAVRNLLAHGADTHGKKYKGTLFNPLIQTIFNEHSHIVSLLLKQPNINPSLGAYPPLMAAVQLGDVPMVKALLEAKTNKKIRLNFKNKMGTSAIMVAALAGDYNVVDLLVQQPNIQLNGITTIGLSLLSGVAEMNHIHIMQLLLNKKSKQLNMELEDKVGNSVLIQAAKRRQGEMVDVLLSSVGKTNININHQNKWKETALFCAVQLGEIKMANALIKSHADVSVVEDEGWTLAGIAARWGHAAMIPLLAEAKAPLYYSGHVHSNAALMAAAYGHLPVIEKLAEEKAALDEPDPSDNWTPLFYAAEEGNIDMADILMEHKADINRESKEGITPLAIAVRNDHLPLVRRLIEKKSALNTVDQEGKTSLHWATIKTNYSALPFFRPSNLETVRLLVEAKADMTIRDTSGQLPSDYASETVKAMLCSQ